MPAADVWAMLGMDDRGGEDSVLRLVFGLGALAACSPCFAQGYQLGVGDSVSIQVYNEAALSRISPISSACRVDMPRIGMVEVCGRTTADIAEDVRGRLAAGYLVDPDVIVEVAAYGSQKVQVKGAVKNPGIQVLTGPTSLSQIITAAGGPQGENVVEVQVSTPSGVTTTYLLSKLDQEVLVSGGDDVLLVKGQHVYIDGEVKNEGPVPYHEGLTVSQAVSLAGGPGEYGSNRRVWILKANGERIVVNLVRVRDGRDADVMLEPDDRVTMRHSYL